MVQANIKMQGLDNFKKYLRNFLAVCLKQNLCKLIPHGDFGQGVERQ